MGYSDILIKIGSYLWLINLITIFLLAWYDDKRGVFSSTLVTLLVVAIFAGAMTAYTPDLLQFIRSNKPPDGSEFSYQLGLAAWYLGFSLIYIMMTITIWKTHVWYHIKYSFITRLHLIAILALILLQISRHIERVLFNSDYLTAIYKSGVLSINIGVTTVTAIAIILVVTNFKFKRNMKAQIWSL